MKKFALAIGACSTSLYLGLMFPPISQAGTQDDLACHTRPLSDFIGAQGRTILFFPPVQEMLAWTDAAFVNLAVVDYAGLADKYIQQATGKSLGTTVQGRVLECPTSDGRFKISVVINTSRALGFVQSIEALIDSGFDFLGTPTIFGVKAQDVVEDGAKPALGPATFRMTFYMDSADAPLPDVRLAAQENTPDVRPITLDMRSTTVGQLPDGRKVRLSVQQTGATDASGELVFTREIVTLNKM